MWPVPLEVVLGTNSFSVGAAVPFDQSGGGQEHRGSPHRDQIGMPDAVCHGQVMAQKEIRSPEFEAAEVGISETRPVGFLVGDDTWFPGYAAEDAQMYPKYKFAIFQNIKQAVNEFQRLQAHLCIPAALPLVGGHREGSPRKNDGGQYPCQYFTQGEWTDYKWACVPSNLSDPPRRLQYELSGALRCSRDRHHNNIHDGNPYYRDVDQDHKPPVDNRHPEPLDHEAALLYRSAGVLSAAAHYTLQRRCSKRGGAIAGSFFGGLGFGLIICVIIAWVLCRKIHRLKKILRRAESGLYTIPVGPDEVKVAVPTGRLPADSEIENEPLLGESRTLVDVETTDIRCRKFETENQGKSFIVKDGANAI
ncbi:hypothetical protein B0H13DRAFT_2272473 [Mycena leptocephala]|nr:hypothetical protein B0H13DRAFT_2272473 [Mycena leptocephala]